MISTPMRSGSTVPAKPARYTEHRDFIKDHALLVACPKLDDFQAHQSKLTDILRSSNIKSLTIVHMEVPCCAGLVHMAKQAIGASGKDIPLKAVMIGIRGDVIS